MNIPIANLIPIAHVIPTITAADASIWKNKIKDKLIDTIKQIYQINKEIREFMNNLSNENNGWLFNSSLRDQVKKVTEFSNKLELRNNILNNKHTEFLDILKNNEIQKIWNNYIDSNITFEHIVLEDEDIFFYIKSYHYYMKLIFSFFIKIIDFIKQFTNIKEYISFHDEYAYEKRYIFQLIFNILIKFDDLISKIENCDFNLNKCNKSKCNTYFYKKKYLLYDELSFTEQIKELNDSLLFAHSLIGISFTEKIKKKIRNLVKLKDGTTRKSNKNKKKKSPRTSKIINTQ